MNVPNALSLVRLLLVPLFPVVFYSPLPHARTGAIAVYTLACATDVLDGILARRMEQVTKLGRVLDPLADKLMSAVVIVCIATRHPMLWWAVAVFFVKEVLMGIGAIVQFRKIRDVPSSRLIGKLAAVWFFFTCMILLIVSDISDTLALILILAALAINILALVFYLIRYLHLMRQDHPSDLDGNA